MNSNTSFETSFVFYPSFVEQITAVKNKEIQLRFALALMRYGVYNEMPDFSDIDPLGMLEAAFLPMRRAIDEQRQRRETQRTNGAKGGAPKGNKNAARKQPKTTQNNPKQPSTTKNDLYIDKDIDKDKNIDENKEIDEAKPKREKRFVAPSLADVQKFFNDNGFTSDAEQFYNYYSANGWMIGGKSKMKDWHAAARNWERRQSDFSPSHALKCKKIIEVSTPDANEDSNNDTGDFGGRVY